jgi:hypothetical protein
MSSPATPSPGGPYVQAALICEKLLRSDDAVQSYIRVVDRMTVGAVGPNPPEVMPPQQLDLMLCIAIKSGDGRGRHALKIRPEMPSGERLPALEVGLNLEGGERGHNVNVDLKPISFAAEGLWWFDVLFGDNETLLTRIPLRISYAPQRVVQQAGTESP